MRPFNLSDLTVSSWAARSAGLRLLHSDRCPILAPILPEHALR